MEITWYGHSCFSLKGKDATIVTDPYNDLGIEIPKLKANLLTLSNSEKDKSNVADLEFSKMLDWPGEFEVSAIAVESWEFNGVNVFSFILDGIHICQLSNINDVLSDSLVESIGDVDVLLLPVGGADVVVSAKQAQQIVDAIEPRIVIPMYFSTSTSNLGLNGPEEFLKLMGKSDLTSVPSLNIKSRSDLPEDNMQIVMLESKA